MRKKNSSWRKSSRTAAATSVLPHAVAVSAYVACIARCKSTAWIKKGTSTGPPSGRHRSNQPPRRHCETCSFSRVLSRYSPPFLHSRIPASHFLPHRSCVVNFKGSDFVPMAERYLSVAVAFLGQLEFRKSSDI